MPSRRRKQKRNSTNPATEPNAAIPLAPPPPAEAQIAAEPVTKARMKSGVFYKRGIPIVRFTLEGKIIYEKQYRKGQDVEARDHYYAKMDHMMKHPTFAGIIDSSEDKNVLALPPELLERL